MTLVAIKAHGYGLLGEFLLPIKAQDLFPTCVSPPTRGAIMSRRRHVDMSLSPTPNPPPKGKRAQEDSILLL